MGWSAYRTTLGAIFCSSTISLGSDKLESVVLGSEAGPVQLVNEYNHPASQLPAHPKVVSRCN